MIAKLHAIIQGTWQNMEFLGHISKTISIPPHLLCFIFVILADTLFKNEPLDYLLSEVTLQYYATEPRRR